ncbi:acyl carrier protein [Streptomyces sp. NPDC001890]|uniref:acyl carrier protein n=1 Tax=Streptomyces sp. NPDC001890 TaxID=3364620 RepID=UPI0036A9A6C7
MEYDEVRAVSEIVSHPLPNGTLCGLDLGDVQLTGLGLDSLRVVRLVTRMEKDLDFKFPPDLTNTNNTFRAIHTIADVARPAPAWLNGQWSREHAVRDRDRGRSVDRSTDPNEEAACMTVSWRTPIRFATTGASPSGPTTPFAPASRRT